MIKFQLFGIWALGFASGVWGLAVNNNFFMDTMFDFSNTQKLLLIISMAFINLALFEYLSPS